MTIHSFPVGLMLMGYILLLLPICCAYHGHHHLVLRRAQSSTPIATPTTTISALFGDYGEFVTGTATPCSGSACASPTDVHQSVNCPIANGTLYTALPTQDNFTTICDIDFPGQNIYPFVLAASFENCMAQCEAFNEQNKDANVRCEGFVFAPERLNFADDCYLKSSLGKPTSATLPLIGGIIGTPSAFPVATISSATFVPTSWSSTTLSFTSPSSVTTSAAISTSVKIKVPKISSVTLIGVSTNEPTTQWVEHEQVQAVTLSSELLTPGVNSDLTSEYELASDTGSLTSSDNRKDILSDLSVIPHLSRDGGKGGMVNGYHVVIFCDTAGFTTTTSSQKGDMVSFVSSSVALDSDMNGLTGQALTLVDGIGQWQDDVGRLRGFAPMTVGEEAYNKALSGDGHRYAVWPESSLILLNKTHSLQYASIVYDEVDMSTQAATFTTIGNTLLTVSVDDNYGAVAERTVKLLFNQEEVQWGSLGGVRSWGASGIGNTDGKVYVFGQTDNGVLLARAAAASVSDKDSYEYWDGISWSRGMLPNTSTAYVLDTPVMDIDLFYSPYYSTFIVVYLTPNADNTFYWRYLMSDHAIVPFYMDDTIVEDYVENIVKYKWSEEKVLYKTATPAAGGYIYAGCVHTGYFGGDDVTNGGVKMLLSWTQHTGQDADTPESGYAHMTAVVTLE